MTEFLKIVEQYFQKFRLRRCYFIHPLSVPSPLLQKKKILVRFAMFACGAVHLQLLDAQNPR
jgi:hypothetical protein